MKKTSLLFLVICACFLTSCKNELDNYDAPNGGIHGQILDEQTGEPVPLAVNNGSSGTVINLFEVGTDATQSVDFRAKADGSFENSTVFNGKYHVVVNGPFVNPCESDVTIAGQTRLDLKATPYSRINANATATGHEVTVTYTVTPTDPSYTIAAVEGYWNFAPGVDNYTSNQAGKQASPDNSLSGSFTFDLDNDAQYTSNLYKIKSNGNKLYFRVGAQINGNYNYSKIIELVVE